MLCRATAAMPNVSTAQSVFLRRCTHLVSEHGTEELRTGHVSNDTVHNRRRGRGARSIGIPRRCETERQSVRAGSGGDPRLRHPRLRYRQVARSGRLPLEDRAGQHGLSRPPLPKPVGKILRGWKGGARWSELPRFVPFGAGHVVPPAPAGFTRRRMVVLVLQVERARLVILHGQREPGVVCGAPV